MKKWLEFINESKFLKETSLLGYLDIEDYPEIFTILESYEEGKDFLSDDNKIVWDWTNEKLTSEINEETFREETYQVFDLKYLKYTREPIEVVKFLFNDFTKSRVNHYMLKNSSDSELTLGEFESSPEIKKFIQTCIDECNNLDLSWQDRWCYLTIDQMLVEAGKSQREFGWHIDGMQGDEVKVKVEADFQFIWADATPTRFCTKTFNVEGLDPSRHNVFNWLGKQTEEKYCYNLEKEKIYLMNAYHVHSATISEIVQYRRFVRLSFTKTPITSVKMTINPDITYNYAIHQTTGNIPKNLI
jgi:hypothetical protein